jgi:hypothetical protein
VVATPLGSTAVPISIVTGPGECTAIFYTKITYNELRKCFIFEFLSRLATRVVQFADYCNAAGLLPIPWLDGLLWISDVLIVEVLGAYNGDSATE